MPANHQTPNVSSSPDEAPTQPAIQAAGVRSIVVMAGITAVVTGGLLWAMRPAAPNLIALLVQVSQRRDGPHLAILNGGPGDYAVELSGGPGASAREPDAEMRVRWEAHGAVEDVPIGKILREGKWEIGSGQTLMPGRYLVEVTGKSRQGFLCAGAQVFEAPIANSVSGSAPIAPPK